MRLISLDELSQELSVPSDYLRELIEKHVIIPFGGRARLGEPRFSIRNIPDIRDTIMKTGYRG